MEPAPPRSAGRKPIFVSVHVPLTPATHHLIGARQLELMKPTAFLINTSRGPVVEEPRWLMRSFSAGWPARALDVLRT